jgi:flagellar biosynthesis protein FliP
MSEGYLIVRHPGRRRTAIWILGGLVLLSAFLPTAALAQAAGAAQGQGITVDLTGQGAMTEQLMQIVGLVTVLSLAPSILIMTTCFTRIVVVLSLLRTAIGIQQSPPNSVIVSLALFLTFFVMAPTFSAVYQNAMEPLIAHQITTDEAFTRASDPMKRFMAAHTRNEDLGLFIDMSAAPAPATMQEAPLQALVPAFMLSELKRAFEIGFLIFVPFLVIDMAIASVLMSMGMMMLPPVIISLPFKLIFFVLVDGWRLVAGSLVASYGAGIAPQ